MKIQEISVDSKEYPNKLRNIYDPPKKIYVLGNKEIINKKGIAIVGSRKATQYGKKVAYEMSKQLTEKGINVISGLAIGIDEYAHIGSINAQIENINSGKTIAILGSGIDKIYPKQNIELARKIIQTGGCIISEYPLGEGPKKLHFPQRNRIISGLSNGVLVVEATRTSGSLITVDFAIEQGKEVFAIPGDITREQSEGSNELIQSGATMILSSKEILNNI